jgi:ElaB/YqjD/DUF883 family membrane-anchored ribosome-binding protein
MKNRHETTYETPEQIIEHISQLMSEAEAMIAGPIAEKAGSKFADLKERLEDARDKLTEVYGKARRNVIAGAKYADNTIRENPYVSLGAALGVGVVLGMLIKRSSR